jgi:hypothetical protein
MPGLSMIKCRFIALLLATMVSVSLPAEEPSIKLSLSVRSNYWYKSVGHPLAFRIENAGNSAIKGGDIAGIFSKGIIHALPKDGQDRQYILKDHEWLFGRGFVPNDLQPGETAECALVGNLLTFFPSTKDGVYQVWWTLGDLKSDVLHFIVTKGKLSDE